MTERLERLRSALAGRGLDALVLAAPEGMSPTNVRYLTGFTGSSSYLVVTQAGALFLTDSRYSEQAASQVRGCTVAQHGPRYEEDLVAALPERGRIGFEARRLSVHMLGSWRERLGGAEFVAADGLVEELRIRKDAGEAAQMRKVAVLAGAALEDVLGRLEPGWTERALARELARAMEDRGLDAPGFPFIVASGPRGSLPHAEPTDRELAQGELVTVDFGGALGGYLSDETVTFAVGRVDGRLRAMYDVVQRSQAAGIAAVRAGARASEVDRASRDVVLGSEFREHCFSYGVGHGVGLDIHEEPFAARPGSGREDRVLESGMTLTVEPGIYVPAVGGVRLEDTLLVTDAGHEILTPTPKDFRAI